MTDDDSFNPRVCSFNKPNYWKMQTKNDISHEFESEIALKPHNIKNSHTEMENI